MTRLFASVLLLSLCACGSDDAEPQVGDPACDNLDTSSCVFPFPSDFFRQPGGPYGQDFHLDLGPSLPLNEKTEIRISPEPFKAHDGYPVVPAITFVLPEASLAGAPPHGDIAASLAPASKTLVIDTQTGELQAHWAEFDYLAEDAGARVIQLRLARELAHDRRYVVAVRGLVDDAGAPVPATPGFAALRDGTPSNLVGIEERRARHESDVFGPLAAFGVARGELQLAWDFTTTSEAGSIERLLSMRDQLYAAIGDLGPEYEVTEVIDDPDGPTGTIARIIEGRAQIPNFLLPQEMGQPRRLRLGDDGLPVAEGRLAWDFRLQIPRSVLDAGVPVPVLQYGHGFLGSDNEANNGWLREWADRHGFIILSCDMQGMNIDAGVIWFIRLPEDATNISHISEEPLQGVINHFALQRLVKGAFVDDPAVDLGGTSLIDPTRLYYHGNSQGGTMGNLFVLPSLDVTRGVLGVPGVSIGFILARASQWQEMSGSILKNYPNPYEFSAIMSLVQIGWDKTDAINFAPRWADLPGTPAKQVLLQAALADSQVNIDVSRLLARLYEAKLIEPATREIFGLETAPPPITGANAYQEYDFGVPDRTQTHRPADAETDTHGFPRKLAHVQDQAWHFLETGEAIATCDGICDPD
jgi:hypothetical protein